tara:strand:+ start:420 stop:578 length:159 start_codon:yes stop_codon:yes gene_type:complete
MLYRSGLMKANRLIENQTSAPKIDTLAIQTSRIDEKGIVRQSGNLRSQERRR